jgi:hypothetical protein
MQALPPPPPLFLTPKTCDLILSFPSPLKPCNVMIPTDCATFIAKAMSPILAVRKVLQNKLNIIHIITSLNSVLLTKVSKTM